jgi:hypothetical protein
MWSEVVIINNKPDLRYVDFIHPILIEPYNKKKFYFGQFTNIAYEHTKELKQQFYGDYLLFANVGLLKGTHCTLAREEDATAKIIISEYIACVAQ